MAKRYVSILETIQIRDLLTQHLNRSELTNSEGLHVWRYDQGWDDIKVAATVSPDLNRNHVQAIRTELFGPLRGAVEPKAPPRPGRIPGKLGTLESRVATLERLVRHLCNELGVPCNPNTGT